LKKFGNVLNNYIRIMILKVEKMQLTKAEEQIMQILWELGEGLVSDIRNSFTDPKPSRTTVSTFVRILEKKGYLGHNVNGKVHRYFPLISKSEYSKNQLFGLIENYFNNSFPAMLSFFAQQKELSLKEIEEILKDTKKELTKNKKRK
jgi:predicted transcriptional regulator